MRLCREFVAAAALYARTGAGIVEDEAVHGLSSVACMPTKLSDVGRGRLGVGVAVDFFSFLDGERGVDMWDGGMGRWARRSGVDAGLPGRGE